MQLKSRFCLLLCLITILPRGLHSQNEIQKESVTLFPRQRLFKARIADPTEIQLSARVRFDRGEFIGNIGYSVGLIQWQAGKMPIQFRIEGNTFLVSKLITPDFPVQSTDYTIGFPVDFSFNSFSTRVEWAHISSHLGDDFNRIDDVNEAIVNYGDGKYYFSRPRKYSREFIELFFSQEISHSRLYGGAIWAYHITFDNYNDYSPTTWSLQAGYEWEAQSQKLARPFWAVDFKVRQGFQWSPEVNLQAGYMIGENLVKRMRVGFEIFSGFSNQGQFSGRRERDVSFLLAFDF